MKIFGTLLPLLALPLLAASPALGAPAAPPVLLPYETAPPASTHPSLYSFADVCRLTLAAEPVEGLRFAGAPAHVRFVSRSSAGEATQPRFSVSAPRDGGRWALVLAGLFACAWVAHRRLTSPY